MSLQTKTKVRVKTLGPIEKNTPAVVYGIANALFSTMQEMGGEARSFKVDAMPLSLNHQHGRNSKGATWLKKEQTHFHELVWATIPIELRKWNPKGVLAAIIIFQSPDWISKAYTIREKDVDNHIKPVLDAIQKATGIKDERYWNVTAFKVCGRTPKTIVHLFSLGDLIDFHL